MSLKVLELTDW